MNLQVDDPVGFVNDMANWAAMESAVADMAGSGVDAEDVTVSLTVVNVTRRRLRDTEERRLQDHEERRLQNQEVLCAATISVEDTAQGNTLQGDLEQLTPAEIQVFAQVALAEAGSAVMVTVAAAPMVDVHRGTTTMPPSPAGSGQASAASLRWKAFSLAPFFAVSAWLLSNV